MLLNDRRQMLLAVARLAGAMEADDLEQVAHFAARSVSIITGIQREARDDIASRTTCPTCHGLHTVPYGLSGEVPCPDCQPAESVLLEQARVLGARL
jgi:hypothetical protein